MENKNMIIIITLVLVMLGIGLAYFLSVKKSDYSMPEPFVGEIRNETDLKRLLNGASKIEYLQYEIKSSTTEGVFFSRYYQKGLIGKKEAYNDKTELIEIVLASADSDIFVHRYLPQLETIIKEDTTEMSEKDIVEYFFTSSVIQRAKVIAKKDFKIIGEEKIDGKDCVIIEMKEDYMLYNTETEMFEKIGETVLAKWIWKDYGIILKMESNNKDGYFIEEIKNISFEKIPASFFALPKGKHVVMQ